MAENWVKHEDKKTRQLESHAAWMMQHVQILDDSDASEIGTDVFDIGINDDVGLFNVDADIDTDVSCTDIDTDISTTNVDTSYTDIITIDTNINVFDDVLWERVILRPSRLWSSPIYWTRTIPMLSERDPLGGKEKEGKWMEEIGGIKEEGDGENWKYGVRRKKDKRMRNDEDLGGGNGRRERRRGMKREMKRKEYMERGWVRRLWERRILSFVTWWDE